MHIIIFEYQVSEKNQIRFEDMYGSGGEWTRLFQKSHDYQGTQLFKQDVNTYLTIDHWTSQVAYESFLTRYAEAYKKLDSAGEELTYSEKLIGKYLQVV